MSNGSSTVASKSKTSSTFHLFAGLASGFTSAVLLQPADLLKTRVQQSQSSSLLDTLRLILRSPQPIRQLWRGTLPSTIRTSFGSALYFTALNAMRTRLATTSPSTSSHSARTSSSALPRLSPTANLLSGAVARASVGFIMMPITVIKVRYESSLYAEYRSLWGAARSIWTVEGLRGFFSGFGATAIRDAPYAGLYVLFYEWGKSSIGGLFRNNYTAPSTATNPRLSGGKTDEIVEVRVAEMKMSTSAITNFASGAMAASAATAVTNPPDAIKTRLQLKPSKYRNTIQAAKLMLSEEGIRSMFDGLGLRMARKAMSSALAWTVYEEVVRRAEQKFVDT